MRRKTTIRLLCKLKLNSTKTMISKALKSVTKIIPQFLMNKRKIEDWKKILKWWRAIELMLRKKNWLKKIKELVLVRSLGKIMETYRAKKKTF